MARKIKKLYLTAGVQSAWLVVPFVRTIYVMLPDGTIEAFVGKATLQDPATGITLELAAIFG